MEEYPRFITRKFRTEVVERIFNESIEYKLNLNNPKTFNEKIQWLKLNYRNSLMTTCSDKYAVRSFVESKVGADVLIELVGKGVYEKVTEIDFEDLPDKFVLKTTNGSGTNIICPDKSKLNIQDSINKLNTWMEPRNAHYYKHFEWAYRDIKPRIVSEKFIDAMDDLMDYKFMCFNGEPELVFVCSERSTGNLKIDFYDMDWNHLPFERYYPNSKNKISKPKSFDRMVEIARKLSKDFPFVRVDLYEVDGNVKFGELTFYPGNGTEGFSPVEWDEKIGDLLILPNRNQVPYVDIRIAPVRDIFRRYIQKAKSALNKKLALTGARTRENNALSKHNAVIAATNKQYYEGSFDGLYTREKQDKKLLAFYLPQFHPIPINDKSFGKGFTEWSNVVLGRPKYIGQLQPILPGELGFYDLRVDDVMKRQIDLAKQSGVYAFVYYYYWFSGQKVMDMPLNTMMKHKEWDFNFSICWVNANWTRRWGDGQANEVIIANKDLDEDPLNFIKDVEDILNDSRYVTHEGAPMLTVYSIKNLKDTDRYISVWRQYFRDKYNKELYIVGLVEDDGANPQEKGFDIGAEFIPMTLTYRHTFWRDNAKKLELIDPNFSGYSVDYGKMVSDSRLINYHEFPVINAISPAWDNEARRRGQADSFSFYGSNPYLYGKWLRRLLRANDQGTDFIFINAWNEWAEGATMEPTSQYGYAVLNETGRAIIESRK